LIASHQNYFRDYDPAVGRYVESDPIGLRAGTNTYSYVRDVGVAGSNPVTPTNDNKVHSDHMGNGLYRAHG
jgi:RHS repeat-associated protein